MTGGDQRRSLWADPPPDEAGRAPDVVARVLPDEPEESPPREHSPRPAPPRAPTAGVIGVILAVALAAALAGRGSLDFEEVPSAWEDVAMTCKTTRFEEGPRALELFRCRALGGRALPPGEYRSPDARWTSDLTRRDARVNSIEISPDGDLRGWAAY